MGSDAVFGIRFEDGCAWIDVCDANGVHSVALDPSAAIVTGKSLLNFGRRRQAAVKLLPQLEHCNCQRNESGMVGLNSGCCPVHPLPGCPKPGCGETWVAAFHGDRCDSCGWVQS